jgi:predicted porin
MKKSLMALALFGAFAGVAHAQTAVQIYGNLNVGFIKRSGQTLNIGKLAANTLGFKGTEELGNGLKALFQMEIRYEPDTGTVENGNRPLFQGESRVGLQGDFGMVRIGRGRPALQETLAAFDPWRGQTTPVGFYTDIELAGYNSSPLNPDGPGNTNNNRWSNAVWYNTNVYNGFQLNTTFATKEPTGNPAPVGVAPATVYPINAEASVNPFSVTGTYNNGPFGAVLGYERNAVEHKVYSIGGSFAATTDLRVMAVYTHLDQAHTRADVPRVKAWILGANYALGPGKINAGYGQKHPENAATTKQLSLGYDYSLSKRTFVFLDASRKKDITTANGSFAIPSTVNTYDIGLNHSF